MPLPTAAKKKTAPVAAKKSAPVAAKKGFPAKKAGGAPAKKVAAPANLTVEQKKKLFLHKAPSDFKPFWMELNFQTLKDGMIGPKFSANRVKGRWDNADAKRFDMTQYDAPTVTALLARIGGLAYATNPVRRLSPGKSFGIVLRVSKASATGTVNCSLTAAKRTITKDGTTKWSWFNKEKHMTDADYKKLRRMVRFLRGAFVNVQLPPSGRAPKKGESEE